MSINLREKIVAQKISPLIQPEDIAALKNQTGNIYQTIVIVGKRANQINEKLQEEIKLKIQEFSTDGIDSYEDIHENQEQIEISRAYEQLANPALLALSEFKEKSLLYGKETHLL